METQELKMVCSKISEIIKETNNENVYDNIITFLNLTSNLYDHREEINEIPVAQQHPSWSMRLFNRKKARTIDEIIKRQEEEKTSLYKAISNAGRWRQGHNRTEQGEKVTKEKVFFGLRTHGNEWHSIAEFEKCKASEPTIYNSIASQMTNFIKNFDGYFDKTTWL